MRRFGRFATPTVVELLLRWSHIPPFLLARPCPGGKWGDGHCLGGNTDMRCIISSVLRTIGSHTFHATYLPT